MGWKRKVQEKEGKSKTKIKPKLPNKTIIQCKCGYVNVYNSIHDIKICSGCGVEM